MPTLEESHPCDAFAAKGTEAAARVANRFAADLVTHPVCNPRRGASLPAVAPDPGGHTAAAHAVGQRQRFEQPWNLRRRVLHVSIDRHQDATARNLDAGPQ